MRKFFVSGTVETWIDNGGVRQWLSERYSRRSYAIVSQPPHLFQFHDFNAMGRTISLSVASKIVESKKLE